MTSTISIIYCVLYLLLILFFLLFTIQNEYFFKLNDSFIELQMRGHNLCKIFLITKTKTQTLYILVQIRHSFIELQMRGHNLYKI